MAINWGKTTNPKTVNKDFRKFPDANIGVATGAASGIFVIEADTPEGHDIDGLASIKALEAEHGALPDTLMAISPSGSVHRYFEHPGAQIKDLELRWQDRARCRYSWRRRHGDRAAVSQAQCREYKWLNDVAIANAPTWLIEAVRSRWPTDKRVKTMLAIWRQIRTLTAIRRQTCK